MNVRLYEFELIRNETSILPAKYLRFPDFIYILFIVHLFSHAAAPVYLWQECELYTDGQDPTINHYKCMTKICLVVPDVSW